MAKTVMAGASPSASTSTANTTQWPTLAGDKSLSATEANGQVILRTAGTLSDFGVRIATNSVNASTVFTVRLNGADTASVLTVPTSTTGWFEDITHSFAVVAGDLVVARAVPGAGSTGTYQLYVCKMEFDTTTSTTATVTRMGTTVGTLNTGHTAASTSYYYAVGSAVPTGSTTNSTESVSQNTEQYSATYRNLGVKVTVNSRASASTARLRKNGANGNLAATITASTTGWFEDTSNTDTVVASDKVNLVLTTGTGTSALSLFGFVVDYLTTTNPGTGHLGLSYYAGPALALGTTSYTPVVGKFNTDSTTESTIQMKLNAAYKFKGLTVEATQNNLDATSTVRLRVNAADAAMTLTIAANTTGVFTDLVNTVTIAANDAVAYKIVTGSGAGGDTITLRQIWMWTEIAGVSTTVDCTVTGATVTNKFITVV